MGYDDDEEYGGGGGYGRNRSASPPKVVDVEKIKPNTEENKGEIRYAFCSLSPPSNSGDAVKSKVRNSCMFLFLLIVPSLQQLS